MIGSLGFQHSYCLYQELWKKHTMECQEETLIKVQVMKDQILVSYSEYCRSASYLERSLHAKPPFRNYLLQQGFSWNQDAFFPSVYFRFFQLFQEYVNHVASIASLPRDQIQKLKSSSFRTIDDLTYQLVQEHTDKKEVEALIDAIDPAGELLDEVVQLSEEDCHLAVHKIKHLFLDKNLHLQAIVEELKVRGDGFDQVLVYEVLRELFEEGALQETKEGLRALDLFCSALSSTMADRKQILLDQENKGPFFTQVLSWLSSSKDSSLRRFFLQEKVLISSKSKVALDVSLEDLGRRIQLCLELFQLSLQKEGPFIFKSLEVLEEEPVNVPTSSSLQSKLTSLLFVPNTFLTSYLQELGACWVEDRSLYENVLGLKKTVSDLMVLLCSSDDHRLQEALHRYDFALINKICSEEIYRRYLHKIFSSLGPLVQELRDFHREIEHEPIEKKIEKTLKKVRELQPNVMPDPLQISHEMYAQVRVKPTDREGVMKVLSVPQWILDLPDYSSEYQASVILREYEDLLLGKDLVKTLQEEVQFLIEESLTIPCQKEMKNVLQSYTKTVYGKRLALDDFLGGLRKKTYEKIKRRDRFFIDVLFASKDIKGIHWILQKVCIADLLNKREEFFQERDFQSLFFDFLENTTPLEMPKEAEPFQEEVQRLHCTFFGLFSNSFILRKCHQFQIGI